MRLLEHEAKKLLSTAGITLPASSLSTSPALITFPAVLKSQVLTGGRGKAGGIVVVDTKEKVQPAIDQLLTLPINGFLPRTILIEEKLSIKRELYLSFSIDRSVAAIVLMAHTNGGVEVEDNTDFKTWIIDGQLNAVVTGQQLASYYSLPEQTFALQDLLEKLYSCFIVNDATLLEINPLILTTDGKLLPGDCKMTLDDAAAFRHQWRFEETPAQTNFVTINPQGNVATIANGAGLAMATVDAAFDAGLQPANFLDIGGGANTETLLKAFERIVEYPHIQAIIINIFAGITRADEVARAIVAATQQLSTLPPLYIRLAGTNYEAASTILAAEHITIMPDLETCLRAAHEAIYG